MDGIVGCRRRVCLRHSRVSGSRRRQRLQSRPTTGISAGRCCKRQGASPRCSSSVNLFLVMIMVCAMCMIYIQESACSQCYRFLIIWSFTWTTFVVDSVDSRTTDARNSSMFCGIARRYEGLHVVSDHVGHLVKCSVR